jgi:hypothetical protein
VIDRGALLFECRNCWHLSEVDVLKLVECFGADGQVSAVRAKVKCRMSQRRRVRTLVRLKMGREDLAWPPRARR